MENTKNAQRENKCVRLLSCYSNWIKVITGWAYRSDGITRTVFRTLNILEDG
jgi:hypothetical protein